YLRHVLAEVCPGEVVADGVEAGPPEGVYMHILIEQGGQGRQGDEAEHQQLLLLFGIAAVVGHVEEGYHQEEPQIHHDIPGVVAAAVVEQGAEHLPGASPGDAAELLEYKAGPAADQVGDHYAD